MSTAELCQVVLPDNLEVGRPLVVVIGGSSGGLRSLDQAQFYASRGYPAAVIPYFALDGLPAELKCIPLEHFRDCLQSITARPELQGRRVYLQGTSKGAEASLLLCAKRIVDVDGAILISPSRYVWGAAADLQDLISGRVKEESSWFWQDRPVEFVPFDPENPVAPEVREIDGMACFVFRDTWYPRVSGPVGEIDLRELGVPLLVFSGRDDQLWPSHRAACEIEDSLRSLGKADLVKHVSFSDVGHQLPHPGKEPTLHLPHPQLGYAIAYGGRRERILEASQVWWREVEAFLAEVPEG